MASPGADFNEQQLEVGMIGADVQKTGAAELEPRHGEQLLYIVGAGGVGREVLEVAMSMELRVAGFLDERKAGLTIGGVPVLLPTCINSGTFLVGIADTEVRLRLAHLLNSQGMQAVTLQHPRAVVAADAQIGINCLINAHVTISCGVLVADHCQVHYNTSIGHDASLAVGVTVLPGANVAGNVRIGRGAVIGSGAVVLQGLEIGPKAWVGAGAVVTRDVAPRTVVVGAPARPIRSVDCD